MGFSVQLFETLAWAEELLDPATAADVPRLPRLYTAAGYTCFAGRAEAAARERPSRHRARGRRPLRRLRAGLRVVRRGAGRGVLRRSRPVRGAHRAGRRELRGGRGVRPVVVRRRPAVGRTDRGGARAHRGIGGGRSRARQPVLDRVLVVDRGHGVLALGAPARPRRVGRGHGGRAPDRVVFFEGFIARDAARLHTTDGEPAAALGLFAEALTAFHRAGNVPQLVITLASVPALFERLGRLDPAATLVGLTTRAASSTRTMCPSWRHSATASGARRVRSGWSSSPTVPRWISATPVSTRRSIDAARRDPSPRPAPARPGGLSRREVEVLRLLADGRTTGEIATELFISTRTAEHHIGHIYTKIGVGNRAAATRWAVQHRVVGGAVPA